MTEMEGAKAQNGGSLPKAYWDKSQRRLRCTRLQACNVIKKVAEIFGEQPIAFAGWIDENLVKPVKPKDVHGSQEGVASEVVGNNVNGSRRDVEKWIREMTVALEENTKQALLQSFLAEPIIRARVREIMEERKASDSAHTKRRKRRRDEAKQAKAGEANQGLANYSSEALTGGGAVVAEE